MSQQRALKILLELLEAKKGRSRALARAASAEHRKAKTLADQVGQYSLEYDRLWEQKTSEGSSVLDVQARAAFGDQLRITLDAQRKEMAAAEQNSRFRLQQAFLDQRRAEVLSNYLEKKRRDAAFAREKAETRRLEDDRAAHLRRS
jgi:flagellar biosynthesis chaperone FliJ